MNKKVLTLCAGFLLAGGLVNFANAEDLSKYKGDKVEEVGTDAYFLVMEENGASYAYGVFQNADGTYREDVNKMGEENDIEFEDINNYLWKVTPIRTSAVGAATTTYGYALQNSATGKYLTFDATGKVVWADKYDESDRATYINLPYDAEYDGTATLLNNGNWSVTTNDYIRLNNGASPVNSLVLVDNSNTAGGKFLFYKVKEKELTDTDLNELYNSTGFNLKLKSADYKDVANIFDDQRIKAIKVGRGTNLEDPVKSSVDTDYGYPAGTYFVISTPKGAYPENQSGNEGEQYNYLQQCTFIAVNPVENDINSKADREAGKGFQLTTVLGSDMNQYIGSDTQKQPTGRKISTSNAAFEVSKNVKDEYQITVPKFWYNKAKAADIKDTDVQVPTTAAYTIAVTDKVGEDHEEQYLTTSSESNKFIFSMEEVFTQKALDWLNTNGMAAYNVQFVNTEDEVAEDMYLYCPAYGNKAYAKGAKFVDLNAPETQFVITDVNTDDNSLTFTNRANHNQSITVKLYEETDGVYSIAVDPDDQANDDFTVISVDNNGNLNEGEELSIHGQWAKITPATVDKFAGAWDVDNLTEVTMLFARDNTPTSNKLYVHVNPENEVALNVSNKLSDAVQFQLVKDEKPTYITNIYAYKSGDQVLYKSQGDTVAYYTYKLQAYKDGVAQEDKFLSWNTSDYNLDDDGDNFIIKYNADAEDAVNLIKVDPSSTEGKRTGYDRTTFVAVNGWNTNRDKGIEAFNDKNIVNGTITEALQANDVKTYLNIESPEVTLDPKSSYVTMKSDMGVYITMQEDSRDAIVVSNEPMTMRLFVTDADRQVPSFLVATGYDNASKERMFLFNPTDSVNYLVAEGDYDKEYQWGEGLNKAIFKKAYLNEAEAAHDTLYTEIKGKNVAVSNDADNNKNVQGGLDKFKFQIILAEDEDNLYWIRQNGEYLTSVNGKLAFSGDLLYRPQALKVEVTDTDMPTANESINATDEAVKVVATNGAVIVKGAEGKNVVVSTILGKVVANEVLNSDNETIAAPAGIVVVSVDGESFKVAVK